MRAASSLLSLAFCSACRFSVSARRALSASSFLLLLLTGFSPREALSLQCSSPAEDHQAFQVHSCV